ncbi:hypothetical protein HGG75_11455 [Ochrobactrum pseudogrignonense]|nr:hypothetical protein [Brucella pseudogrignonensis]
MGVLMQAADVSADDAAHLEQALGRKDLVPVIIWFCYSISRRASQRI